jgi:hypothetical protein
MVTWQPEGRQGQNTQHNSRSYDNVVIVYGLPFDGHLKMDDGMGPNPRAACLIHLQKKKSKKKSDNINTSNIF